MLEHTHAHGQLQSVPYMERHDYRDIYTRRRQGRSAGPRKPEPLGAERKGEASTSVDLRGALTVPSPLTHPMDCLAYLNTTTPAVS